MAHLTTLLTLILFTCLSHGAQTSLYFPGFDPQPLSVDFVSTDSQGHTVWAVHGSQDASGNGGFPGAMTLVEGSGYASLGYTNKQLSITLDEVCGVTSSAATCTVTANGAITTTTDSSITLLTANVGTTAPRPAQSTAGPTSTAATQTGILTSAPGNTASSVLSTASFSATSTSTTTRSNSASHEKMPFGSGQVLSLILALLLSLFGFYM